MKLIQPKLSKPYVTYFLGLFLLFFGWSGSAQIYQFSEIGPAEGLPASRINDMLQDQRGLYWLATDGAGLLRYDGFSFKRIEPKLEDWQPIAQHLAEDPKGILWFTSGSNLLRYDGLRFKRYAFPDDLDLQGLTISGDQPLLLGKTKSFIFRKENFQIWQGAEPPLNKSAHGPAFSARLQRDSLIIEQGDSSLVITYENGLPQENFQGVIIDSENVIWLYHDEGLVKLEDLNTHFFKVGEQEVHSILKVDQRYFLGTGSGLYQGPAGGPFLKSSNQPDFGVILALESFQKRIWLATEKGLFSYKKGVYQKHGLQDFGNDFVFDLEADSEFLWVATGGGLFAINGDLKRVSPEANLPATTVFDLALSPEGDLWFATFTNGCFKRTAGEWQQVSSYGGLALDSIRIKGLDLGRNGVLWLNTSDDGVLRVDSAGVRRYGPERLEYAEARSLVVHGNLAYVGTNKGIFRIENNEVIPQNLYNTRVMSQLVPQSMKLDRGELLAGLQGGFVRCTPTQQAQKPANLLLVDVQLFFGEVKNLSDYADSSLPFAEIPYNLRLPHNLNFISFTLSGVSGRNPDGLRYRYRIKEKTEWTEAANRREAIFARLSPGSYLFEAQVARPGQPWSSTQVSYPFVIEAPLWQRWYFIAGVLLLAGLLTFLYFRERYVRAGQRLKLENSLMEMERKALQLQMNPHFIFNALDSISSFIFKNDPKQAVRYLNNFAKLMRLTLESSMEHLHPVETEVSILKNYLELEMLRFKDKFDYEIELDEEIDYNVGIPPMLIQPHVENAILHGIKPKDSKAHLDIRFILDDDMLVCEIQDDGIGRKASRKLKRRQDHRSLATRINRDRIQLLGQAMNEDVSIKIVDLENPSGTRVIIRLPAKYI